MAKANADYGRLADKAEIEVEGRQARVDRMTKHLSALLKDNPNKQNILQTIERLTVETAYLLAAKEDFDRYVKLRDRDTSENGSAAD